MSLPCSVDNNQGPFFQSIVSLKLFKSRVCVGIVVDTIACVLT